MIKRLRKVGNSSALILDRPIMEMIGLEENGEVQLTVHSGSLILTPTEPRHINQDEFDAALGKVVSRWRGVLKRLAE